MNKYKLPASHELFQSQSFAELTQEMYEDLYYRKSELESALESGEKDIDREGLLTQLNGVNRALGETEESYDPLVDQWERDIAEGRTPDLNADVR